MHIILYNMLCNILYLFILFGSWKSYKKIVINNNCEEEWY